MAKSELYSRTASELRRRRQQQREREREEEEEKEEMKKEELYQRTALDVARAKAAKAEQPVITAAVEIEEPEPLAVELGEEPETIIQEAAPEVQSYNVQVYQKGKIVDGERTKGWMYQAGPFTTKEEAEQWKKLNPVEESTRIVKASTPETSEAWGGTGSGGQLAEQRRLAQQAVEALSEGKALSTAEKEAFKGTTISYGGITGTGETYLQRLETAEKGLSKLEQGKKLSDLEMTSIESVYGSGTIQKYKQEQARAEEVTQRAAETIPKLKFETAAEAKKAGYEVVEQPVTQKNVPTTRDEYAASLFQKQGYTTISGPTSLKAYKPSEQKQVIVKGGSVLTATGRITPIVFQPSFISELGTGEMKTGFAGFLFGAGKKYLAAEKKVSSFFPEPEKKESATIWTGLMQVPEKYLPGGEKGKKIIKDIYGSALKGEEFTEGMYEGWRTKPIKTGLWGTTFFLLPGAATGLRYVGARSGITAGLKYIPPKLITSAKWLLGGGLTALYGKGVVEEVRAAKKPYKKAGEIFGTEILPMFAGGYLGQKIFSPFSTLKKPPTIKGEQYYGLQRARTNIRTTEIKMTPEFRVEKPSKLVTSRYVTDIAKPSVSVAKSVGGRAKYNFVGIKGTQYTTIKEGPYFIRSTTGPSGRTTTKLFRGDTLLKTFKQKTTPSIKFTEPLRRLTKKELASIPELRIESASKLFTSRGVSALGKGYEARGARVSLQKDLLMTKTLKPKVKTLAKPVIDFKTGKLKAIPKSLEIFKTKYRYVTYPPKQKPLIKELSAEGLFVERPTISKTFQATKVREPFKIEFIERTKAKLPKAAKAKTKLSKFDKQLLKQIERQQTLAKKAELIKAPKLKTTGKIETIKIQKPSQKTIAREILKVYFPALPKQLPALFPIAYTGTKAKSKATSKYIPSIKPTIKTKPETKISISLKQSIIPKAKEKIKSILQPKIEVGLQPKIETKVTQKTLERQLQLQKQLQLLQTTPRTITTTPPPTLMPPWQPPPPPIIPGGGILGSSAEQPDTNAYDVYVREGERRGDRFKKVAGNLPRNKALAKGKEITDRFIEASFRLKRLRKKAKERDLLFRPDLSKYRSPKRKSKLPPNTFIEKRQYRLDTPTETQQISYFKQLKERKQALQSMFGVARQQRRKRLESNLLFLRQSKKKKKQQQVINFLKTPKKSQPQNFITLKSPKSNFFGTPKKPKKSKIRRRKFF